MEASVQTKAAESTGHTAIPWQAIWSERNKRTKVGEYHIYAPTAVGARSVGMIRRKDDADIVTRAVNSHADLVKACSAAEKALRSYQYGNAATDLAEEVADACCAALTKAEAQP